MGFEAVSPALFPCIFVGFWLFIVTVFTRLAGWPALQDEFPDWPEDRVEKVLHFQSGMMGYMPMGGVQYGGCMRFDVCQNGLRIKIWRIFAPFSKPVFIPWQQISVEKTRIVLLVYVRLLLGSPEYGRLAISNWAARRISDASLGQFHMPDSS